ncbi:hypothetical protein [Candidatus Formimonas warabiya]|uniref:Uncharacterized protein n=1 Tax=Formimonas warabiya TaxID=1761012 RepID=A0A3G1KN02_FORW1|nr:hypothetical protein [Candidatus Formimonas warabiya]ATW23816.1 hypothetical protein DCMF_02500 [Candidatus Formimonas warabiya]
MPNSDSNQLIILSALVALILSEDLSADDLNIIGNFLVGVGSLMLTKAAQLAVQESSNNNSPESDSLEKQVKNMQIQLKMIQDQMQNTPKP